MNTELMTTEDNITLDAVHRVYKTVIGIEEYYHPYLRWVCAFPEGDDIRDMKNIKAGIARAKNLGALKVQLKCADKDGSFCYPDYKIDELIKEK